MDAIAEVLRQAPATASEDDAQRALAQTNGNIVDAIGLLHGILPPPPPAPIQTSHARLNEVRHIADAHDEAMDAFFRAKRARPSPA